MHEETESDSPPKITIVIPIYNEEAILQASIAGLTEALEDFPWTWRILLSENGSTDRTREVAAKLIGKHPEVSIIHSDEPNYGKALRRGILQTDSPIVICDEIDLCDVDFYHKAMVELEKGADLVVGSKTLDRSLDKRPAFRRLATQVINFLLWVFLGFEGTDTHGLKAFKRERLLSVVNKCVVDRDLFASEFVIRAGRMSFRVVEVPVEVIEKRAPSIALTRRVPNVLKGIAKLFWVIRVKNR
ncbi:MAG: glycosyl transferase family 2 [Myxococcales bacterium]|nr:glycosyl transferase family 2 [Myxococcales bacterium]